MILWTLWCFDNNWASAWDFQQCGILTSVDSDENVQPSFKLRNSNWCSFSSLTSIEYSSDLQRLWSDCAYAQADLRLYWSHIPHCWKSHTLAHMINTHTRADRRKNEQGTLHTLKWSFIPLGSLCSKLIWPTIIEACFLDTKTMSWLSESIHYMNVLIKKGHNNNEPVCQKRALSQSHKTKQG